MSSTVTMSLRDALGLVKRSLEMGKVDNAFALVDSLINQLNAEEKPDPLKAKVLQSIEMVIVGLQQAPKPELGEVNWPILLEDAEKVKKYIEEKG